MDEVIPLLPSAVGQSRESITSTGLTSHQIGVVLNSFEAKGRICFKGGPLKNQVSFRVATLVAVVPSGIPVEWQGREFPSGPLTVTLDSEAGYSFGSLDYSERRASVEFRVKMTFPEFAQMLGDMGAAAEFLEPIRAVIRSEGSILEDHSFVLSGSASVAEHALSDDHARGRMLPGT